MKNLVLMLTLIVSFQVSNAKDSDEATDDQLAKIEKSETSDEYWVTKLKTKYNLTDEQVTKLQTSSISKPQMAMVAELAQKSNKSIDEILKMRIDEKMGWGKIAKELGLPPKTIGQSVSQMRHEAKDERLKHNRNEREEKHKERDEKREKRSQGGGSDKHDKKDK